MNMFHILPLCITLHFLLTLPSLAPHLTHKFYQLPILVPTFNVFLTPIYCPSDHMSFLNTNGALGGQPVPKENNPNSLAQY